jgi:hypothetical protein
MILVVVVVANLTVDATVASQKNFSLYYDLLRAFNYHF